MAKKKKNKKAAKTEKEINKILIEVLTGLITGTALLIIEKMING